MFRSSLRFSSLALALLLGGCTLFPKDEYRSCPAITKLHDTSDVVQYVAGKGRDLIDMRFSAELGDIAWKCQYDDEDDGSGELEMELKILIKARKGPAAKGQVAKFPFFVAITDANRNILNKKVFTAEIEFEEGRRRAAVIEEVDQVIFYTSSETGADYDIIVGFQLTPQELKYNRERKR